MSFGTQMPMPEMDVELGQESEALCRSPRLKVTDGVPRGAVNPGRLYLFIFWSLFHERFRCGSLLKIRSVELATASIWMSDITLK
jgi:hypothetical protein